MFPPSRSPAFVFRALWWALSCATRSEVASLQGLTRARAMSKHVSIPVKVLHDAEGHTVTVELKTGEVFRGKLDEAEDNMNLHISNCTKTAKDGRVSTLASVFLRGSHVRFMVLPDILKNAPFFKKIETKQAKQAQAKSGNKSQQAAQQRASGRRDVGLPEKQKIRDARKNPNFS